MTAMTDEHKARRPGYAPDNAAVGRRGLHTRERIVRHAGRLFVAQGYHGTSMDAIAKAVGGSRATVYQYFQSKDDIFQELLGQCEPAVVDHGQRLSGLGPHHDGVANLHRWLVELEELYDRHAIVFLEFPGIGLKQGVPPARADAVSGRHARLITETMRRAGVRGLDPADAAGALLRISHMVNLYRFKGMLGLDRIAPARTSTSLAAAMQLLLFPETPPEVLVAFAALVCPADAGVNGVAPAPPTTASEAPDPGDVSPTRQDMLSGASTLFAEHGYFSVSMDDIAAAANVSRATLYRHFNSKVKVLEELSAWSALEGRHLAADLHQLADGDAGPDALRAWLSRYVHFHRTYGGVIRAWYDGTVAQQLPEDTVTVGLGAFHSAVADYLHGTRLPVGIDPLVAVAIFLAVMGRLTEMAVSQHPLDSDYETASLMMLVLQRTLLGTTAI